MTNIKTLPIFSIPLTTVNFGKEAESLNRELIKDSFLEQKDHPVTQQRSAIGGWQSDSNLENKYESFSILRDTIKKCIHSILPSYGYNIQPETYDKELVCDGLWVNILTSRSSYHMPHIHGTGNTLLTGVYYPTSGLTPEGKDFYEDEDYNDVELRASTTPNSGDIVLFDPAACEKRQVIPEYVNRYPYYGSELCISPKHSHLIIFPNYLTHMVAPITKDDFYRMSISFNFGKLK